MPADGSPAASGFIDLHQDILSGVARIEGGFPRYGSSYLHGSPRAVVVWSSLYPDDRDDSLVRQLDAHRELLGSYGSSLRLITTAEDLDKADDRTGVLPHSEGLVLPGTGAHDLELLWSEHELRSLSLTWNYETPYGFSCYDDDSAPLKPSGRRLVAALQLSPLFLDLAHLNGAGFFEALERYAPPALVTHSFCRGIVDHPRGMTDDQLRALGDHGGLVGLAFFPDFLGRQGSIDEALRHIDRIASLAGDDAVSIGSDWGVAPMGELGDPAALVGLVDAVAGSFGPDLAEKFAFANASAFLHEQLPRRAEPATARDR